jgi:hypothetical protein
VSFCRLTPHPRKALSYTSWPCAQSNDLYSGPSELFRHRRKGAAWHTVDMVWLYRSPFPVGGGFTCSNYFYLSSRHLERGGGSAPCGHVPASSLYNFPEKRHLVLKFTSRLAFPSFRFMFITVPIIWIKGELKVTNSGNQCCGTGTGTVGTVTFWLVEPEPEL